MFDEQSLIGELSFKAVRSSGSGGQHVNKVASKVELQFDLEASSVFNNSQKMRLKKALNNRLNNTGVLILQCDETRSQHQNKTIVIKRFLELIKIALIEEKERIPTKVPNMAIKKRLKNKRLQSKRKENRKRPDIE